MLVGHLIKGAKNVAAVCEGVPNAIKVLVSFYVQ